MNPRLRRLENDYQEVRKRFDGDMRLKITPVGTNPPQQYQIIYSVPSLRINGNAPFIANNTVVNLTLPIGYPKDKPHAETLDEVFHPNFGSWICIADFWSPAQSLADIIVLIGDMLQWKKYNIRSPLNAIAAEWAVEHSAEIPLSDIELGTGDPLEIKIGESF
jgi:ubiquitin-protein ligase